MHLGERGLHAVLRQKKFDGSADRLVHVALAVVDVPKSAVGDGRGVPFDFCRGAHGEDGDADGGGATATVAYGQLAELEVAWLVRTHENGQNLHHGTIGVQWIGAGARRKLLHRGCADAYLALQGKVVLSHLGIHQVKQDLLPRHGYTGGPQSRYFGGCLLYEDCHAQSDDCS